MMGYYGLYGMRGWDAGFGGLGMIFVVVFWALVIWAIIALLRGPRRRWWHEHMHEMHGDERHGNSALDLLKERYVKGEIDKKEFDEKKKDLE